LSTQHVVDRAQPIRCCVTACIFEGHRFTATPGRDVPM
jgi:hypothetical protein